MTTATDILARLKEDPAADDIEFAKDWISTHTDDSTSTQIFKAIVMSVHAENQKNWILSWLSTNQYEIEQRVSVVAEEMPNNLDALTEWGISFAEHNQQLATVDSILISLLQFENGRRLTDCARDRILTIPLTCDIRLINSTISICPDERLIDLALQRLHVEPINPSSNLLLVTLLEKQPTEKLCDLAIDRLIEAGDATLMLAVSPMLEHFREKTAPILSSWIEANPHNPESLYVLFECLRAAPSQFGTAMTAWLRFNASNSTGIDLLLFELQNETPHFSSILDWIRIHPAHNLVHLSLSTIFSENSPTIAIERTEHWLESHPADQAAAKLKHVLSVVAKDEQH
jgi:hypothetical protein